MPACVIKKNALPTPDGNPMILDYVLPGESFYFFAEQRQDVVGRSILMECDNQDRAVAVYNGPENGRPMNPQNEGDRVKMAARCIGRNAIGSVMPDQAKPFYLHDYKEGLTEITIAHVETWSFN